MSRIVFFLHSTLVLSFYINVVLTLSIGSDNGLSPGRCRVIILIDDGTLLIGPLGTNLSEIIIEIHALLANKMPLDEYINDVPERQRHS